jgi:predicted DCC family thiol-disulfide oxidoreductase YuxK
MMKKETDFLENIEGAPILFFDGVCNLCNGAVDFIIKNDKSASIRFAAIQSESGQVLLKKAGFYVKKAAFSEKEMNTLVFLKDGKMFIKSDAALEIAQILGGGWKILTFGKFLPRLFRDGIYDFIARNRYRFFGKKETCRLPTSAERGRLIG